MAIQNIPLLVIIVVLGLSVLASYIPIARSFCPDYWAGITRPHREVVVYGAMVAAAVGFLLWAFHYVQRRPESRTNGIFKGRFSLEALVIVALLGSIMWSVVVFLSVTRYPTSRALKYLTSASLIVVAVASLLLLAGTFEDGVSPTYALAGIISFSCCTVLIDGVGWNSRWILRG